MCILPFLSVGVVSAHRCGGSQPQIDRRLRWSKQGASAGGRRCTEPHGSQSFGESVWFCTGSWLPLAGYRQFLRVLHPAGFGDSPPSSCLGVFTLGACSVVNSGACFWHLGNLCYTLHSYLIFSHFFWALPDWAITQWIDACFYR